MNDVALVSTLMSIDLFEGLEVKQAEALRDTGRRRTLRSGETLSEPRQVDECLWVLLEGHLRLESADDVALVEMTEPRVLGEMGVFLGLPRGSRIVAVADSEVLEVSGVDLEGLVADDPELGQQLLGNLCRTLYGRLHETNDTLEALRRRHDQVLSRLAQVAPEDPLLEQ